MAAWMTRQPLVVLAVAALVIVTAFATVKSLEEDTGAALGRVPVRLAAEEPAPRTVAAYFGYGTWVDVYDYAPTYAEGGTPALTPDDVDDMAAAGVRTLFIQAARTDERAPADGVVDPSVLAQFLVRAHRHDMRVVGWYLPKFADIELDLRRLEAVADFSVLGHRFDGLAVDIEFTGDVPDHAARNQQLIELSRRLRDRVGDDALGAIVLPAVQIEVVNQRLWPGFPYTELSEIYDVWLPMSYWTFRQQDSGYHDGFHYSFESITRLRTNLGDDAALVHAVGGIGDEATPAELTGFLRSLVDTQAVGGSIYDWRTLGDDARRLLADGFSSGAAADLAPS
jgi:hypothetical protein